MKASNMKLKTTINRRDFIHSMLLTPAAGFALAPTISWAQTVQGLYQNMPLEDQTMGNQNAKVTLLEYASMTCPHCKAFHEQILPDIKKAYIDTGKVKYVLRPFPFDGDRRGEAAFMLAKCAPNDNYYAMLDALFASQQNWAGKGKPVPELLRISKLSGMTETDFKACLSDQELLNRIINGRNLAVQKFNVRATPTIFINDQRFSEPATVESLSAALDGALAG